MALPGADPIAAALAAGETPSPEMVAASTEKEGLSPRAAGWCFAAAIVLIATIPFIVAHNTVLAKAPLENPPDVLAFEARKILNQFGYTQKPKTVAFGFQTPEPAYPAWLDQHDRSHRDAILTTHQPPIIGFWFRQHVDLLIPRTRTPGPPVPAVDYDEPANIEPGMIRLILDANGRLFALEARPEEKGPRNSADPFNWSALFSAAGLDRARFTEATPEHTPPMAFDARAAWTGDYGEGRLEKVRVEAAAWQGRPVYFKISGDWGLSPIGQRAVGLFTAFLIGLVVLILGGNAAVAWNNLRLGRGDRRGANRVAIFAFIIALCEWSCTNAHTASLWELALIFTGLSEALFVAASIWLFYIAIEPYVRRFWPDSLISFTRLYSGRLRDPLVASHLLLAVLLAAGLDVLFNGMFFLNPTSTRVPGLLPLESMSGTVRFWLENMRTGLLIVLAFVLLVVLLRLLFRGSWIAYVGASVVAAAIGFVPAAGWIAIGIVGTGLVISFYAYVWALRRFGLLTVAGASLASSFLIGLPVIPGSWYVGRSLLGLGILAAVACWASWTILMAQRRVMVTQGN